MVCVKPADLLWQTHAAKLFEDMTICEHFQEVNISWGQKSVDAIKPV